VPTFCVIATPRNGVRNTWINTHGSEENTGIPSARALCTYQQGITSHANEGDGHVGDTTLARAIREKTD